MASQITVEKFAELVVSTKEEVEVTLKKAGAQRLRHIQHFGQAMVSYTDNASTLSYDEKGELLRVTALAGIMTAGFPVMDLSYLADELDAEAASKVDTDAAVAG